MRFTINNLNRLKSDVEVMDEDDRIDIVTPEGSFAFRVKKDVITIHEFKWKFKAGDKVKMKYFGKEATGQVTIVSDLGIKVMFDMEFDLDYTYYPAKDLEKI